MVSKLAKSTIEKFIAEGLTPTVDDIILLNELGCDLERNQDMFDFSALPRTAFLGDDVYYEPTLIKKIYLDNLFQLFDQDFQTQVYLTLYVLYTPQNELADISNIKSLKKSISSFVESHLMNNTLSQMFALIDYLLNGSNPHLDDPYDDDDDEDKDQKIKDFDSIFELSDQYKSYAHQLLGKILLEKMDIKIIENFTLPQIERMLAVAYLQRGDDILKSDGVEKTGRYYRASGKIHSRLTEEKKKR